MEIQNGIEIFQDPQFVICVTEPDDIFTKGNNVADVCCECYMKYHVPTFRCIVCDDTFYAYRTKIITKDNRQIPNYIQYSPKYIEYVKYGQFRYKLNMLPSQDHLCCFSCYETMSAKDKILDRRRTHQEDIENFTINCEYHVQPDGSHECQSL